MPPRMAHHLTRSWASTAQHSQAELAEEVPGGDVLHAGPSFRSRMCELDAGVVAVERVELDGLPSEVGEEGEVAPVRPELRLRADEARAPDDEAPALVGRLGDLGRAVVGVVDRDPRRPRRWRRSPRATASLPRADGHREARPQAAEDLSTVSFDQKPESNRSTISPDAPARRSTGDRAPRRSASRPVRCWPSPCACRAWSTSPVSARVARIGW